MHWLTFSPSSDFPFTTSPSRNSVPCLCIAIRYTSFNTNHAACASTCPDTRLLPPLSLCHIYQSYKHPIRHIQRRFEDVPTSTNNPITIDVWDLIGCIQRVWNRRSRNRAQSLDHKREIKLGLLNERVRLITIKEQGADEVETRQPRQPLRRGDACLMCRAKKLVSTPFHLRRRGLIGRNVQLLNLLVINVQRGKIDVYMMLFDPHLGSRN